jgi:non-lysosomal glucosylceramidase
MAVDVGDTAFAAHCRKIYTVGSKNFTAKLFNGEYFQDNVDPRRPDSINSGSGCEIDQVFGQGWAFQVGLGRILPAEQTRTALESLWRYNFTTDCGAYRRINKPGRIYAVDHESGLLMCTFPKPDWNYQKAEGKGPDWAAGYFNECMNGFEHQVASHMIWEGLVVEGLAIERAVHDRYCATKRNPYNEIECGDHYARSMASYGVFLACCGFSYDGPKGAIGFDPRVTPANFKCAFTAAEGWGSFSQKVSDHAMNATLTVKDGKLRVRTLTLGLNGALTPTTVSVTLHGADVAATVAVKGGAAVITLAQDALVTQDRSLAVVLK